MATERWFRDSSRWRGWLDVGVQVAFIVAVAALVYGTFFKKADPPTVSRPEVAAVRREPPLPTEPISIEGSARRGSPDARVVLIEYSDFECPFCGRFANETLALIDEAFLQTGRVQFVFRHLPLPIHRQAQRAAEAAQCAGKQDRFWEMHDRLFIDPKRLDDATMAEYASDIGLDRVGFEGCLSRREAQAAVQEHAESGRALGITATPTFFVGELVEDGRVRLLRRFVGAQPLRIFESELRILTGDSRK